MRHVLFIGTITMCVVATVVTGCSTFLPAHSNSNARAKDVTKLVMYTCDNYPKAFSSSYDSVASGIGQTLKGVCQPSTRFATAPLAAAAAGFAADFVKTKLLEEASLYEAQWSATAAHDDFWKDGGGTPLQNYVGFEVCRVAGEAKDSPRSDDERACAAKLVFGVIPSRDKQLFMVTLLEFQVTNAKAKVLSDEGVTYIPPWFLATFPGKFLRVQGHSIDADISVEMDAYWKDSSQTLQVKKVAAFNIPINGYDIAKHSILRPGDGLSTTPTGWLLSVPLSYKNERDYALVDSKVAGTFSLKVSVTERDTGNGKRLLEKGAELVQSKTPAFITLVKEVASPQKTEK